MADLTDIGNQRTVEVDGKLAGLRRIFDLRVAANRLQRTVGRADVTRLKRRESSLGRGNSSLRYENEVTLTEGKSRCRCSNTFDFVAGKKKNRKQTENRTRPRAGT